MVSPAGRPSSGGARRPSTARGRRGARAAGRSGRPIVRADGAIASRPTSSSAWPWKARRRGRQPRARLARLAPDHGVDAIARDGVAVRDEDELDRKLAERRRIRSPRLGDASRSRAASRLEPGPLLVREHVADDERTCRGSSRRPPSSTSGAARRPRAEARPPSARAAEASDGRARSGDATGRDEHAESCASTDPRRATAARSDEEDERPTGVVRVGANLGSLHGRLPSRVCRSPRPEARPELPLWPMSLSSSASTSVRRA